jgi:hypothetical protein
MAASAAARCLLLAAAAARAAADGPGSTVWHTAGKDRRSAALTQHQQRRMQYRAKLHLEQPVCYQAVYAAAFT